LVCRHYGQHRFSFQRLNRAEYERSIRELLDLKVDRISFTLLSGGRLDRDPVGQNPILKNEYIQINDFRIYEKNTNPTPGVPH